ncbi:MAG: RsmD family RNA methyltransferase [Tidjanibacter sp.]|nr:RsmD family RNA methyltransferase [Tidjanibacter sp.]
MEKQEIELLQSTPLREEIEANIERNPTEIALDKRLRYPREVASQVKYLQRARRKLPSYYTARAILPSLAFEQSSSEECAAHKEYGGHLAVDMTCGLGVDTLYLSRRFERVVAIERNPELAEITRYNLALMGAENVEVVVGSSEEYIATLPHADLIYADPDRRGAEGKKMVCLEDCSPNIADLLPLLKQKCDRLCVKLSPMFDTTEALRAFGEGASVEVVSLGGECKEVLVDWECGRTERVVRATALGVGTFAAPTDNRTATTTATAPFESAKESYRYLVVPDAALRKAGLVTEWCYSCGLACYGGYGFATTEPSGPTIGRTYEVAQIVPYRPKELKRLVSKKIELIRHGFPHSSAAICKALGVREGAGQRWAFAEIGHSLWAIRLK